MELLKYGAIALLVITALILLVFYAKSGKLLKFFLINTFIGVATLIIINLTSRFTGVYLPVNEWTGIGSAVYGVPAVCGFIFLQIIFER